MLTTHLRIVTRLRISGAIPLLPYTSSCREQGPTLLVFYFESWINATMSSKHKAPKRIFIIYFRQLTFCVVSKKQTNTLATAKSCKTDSQDTHSAYCYFLNKQHRLSLQVRPLVLGFSRSVWNRISNETFHCCVRICHGVIQYVQAYHTMAYIS
jgi:hypothetical protein